MNSEKKSREKIQQLSKERDETINQIHDKYRAASKQVGIFVIFSFFKSLIDLWLILIYFAWNGVAFIKFFMDSE